MDYVRAGHLTEWPSLSLVVARRGTALERVHKNVAGPNGSTSLLHSKFLMSNIAIACKGLSKQYAIGQPRGYVALRDVIANAAVKPFERLRLTKASNENGSKIRKSIWALKDLTLEIESGEVVGIIGRNGAGKSTLLKILSRITKPTSGHATITGRVGSLLEVGTGFHPELTGRENIYLNGAIIGMRKAEIVRKFDEIIEFAEVEQFVDTPVKRYSSGMYVRLAFGVAAHMETEVLLVDEVLAVGDIGFQKKCLNKMGSVAKDGRTVLLVSHNMAAISNLCRKSFSLENGRLRMFGDTGEVVQDYLSSSEVSQASELEQRLDRSGSGDLRFTNITLERHDGEVIPSVFAGDEAVFVVGFRKLASLRRNIAVDMALCDGMGQRLLTLSSRFSGDSLDNLPEEGFFVCRIPRLPLLPGSYTVDLWCGEATGATIDYLHRASYFEVSEGDFYKTGKLPTRSRHGYFMCDHRWLVRESRSLSVAQSK
jgi:lipopolysaccharide transport system ATP-binding protein